MLRKYRFPNTIKYSTFKNEMLLKCDRIIYYSIEYKIIFTRIFFGGDEVIFLFLAPKVHVYTNVFRS